LPTYPSSSSEQVLCPYTYSNTSLVSFDAEVAANGAYSSATASAVTVVPTLGWTKTVLDSVTAKPTIGKILNLTATVQGPASAAAATGFVQFLESMGPGKDYSPVTSCCAAGEVGLNTADQAECNVSPVTTTERFEAKYLGDNETTKGSTSDLLKPVIHKGLGVPLRQQEAHLTSPRCPVRSSRSS
jgi:hypothetical protein